ncbi:MAG TPA: phosphate ABC transporter substrate-binding protein [Burkholderiales bacterium]|nr:phosphate ABC transporter substrate-binding protein [Burkholderiales bacterium]
MRLARNAVAAGMLALAALLAATSGYRLARAATPNTLVVAGSPTLAPLMADIARRFEAANPGVTVEIRALSSGAGVEELRARRCDVAMIARPVGQREKGLYAFPIARDGVAIIVQRENPVRALTQRQLVGVLTGDITDWKHVGGRSGPIRVAWRTEGAGTTDVLLQSLKLRSSQIRSHAVFFESTDALQYAAANPGAITFASLGVAESLAKSGTSVKLLAYDGVPASRRTLSDHTYALARPLILLTTGMPSGMHKRLIDYATSGAVADLDEKHGFVPYRQ